MSDRITHLDPTREASFGFPSGHTLCMVSMLGYAAMSYGSPWGVVAYVTMVVLTCISRLYTGAHFVVDVRVPTRFACLRLFFCVLTLYA